VLATLKDIMSRENLGVETAFQNGSQRWMTLILNLTLRDFEKSKSQVRYIIDLYYWCF